MQEILYLDHSAGDGFPIFCNGGGRSAKRYGGHFRCSLVMLGSWFLVLGTSSCWLFGMQEILYLDQSAGDGFLIFVMEEVDLLTVRWLLQVFSCDAWFLFRGSAPILEWILVLAGGSFAGDLSKGSKVVRNGIVSRKLLSCCVGESLPPVSLEDLVARSSLLSWSLPESCLSRPDVAP
ncbi:Hypothetical predicted protein [Pelobates cultripes]|uniref:Uncharacterized protein n=1 Tax=Pelobates cultripes TaxID=61616 RepID=A0AAD1R4C1_PELCU|nr:Hypothetical predicted protein [Pelobates cultripes]